ncbi:hypothetical protein [Shimia sp.]|uniref:spike base protein, RCAP_Rcc01079 family n=1 Tax=Shimia sp. TaxID=1954381 RepID=UPI00326B55A9
MADTFANYAPGLESPATHLVAVTSNDTVDLTFVSRAINVGQSGYVRLTTTGGETETIYIAAGGAFPIRATRVWATGTTAAAMAVAFPVRSPQAMW